jgi:hypothetical protein
MHLGNGCNDPNNPNHNNHPHNNYECDDYDNSIEVSIDSSNPIEFDGKLNADEIFRLLHGKVDKVKGKGLSSNDFTDYFKNIISGLGQTLSGFVPKTTKINNKPLSSDITLTASDVGAQPAFNTYREVFITVDNQTEITLLHTPQSNKEVICINGLIAYPGTEHDYILQDNIIAFNYPMLLGEKIMATYSVQA